MHDFVISDDLDADFLTSACDVSCPNDVWENSLAGVAENVVSAIQHFAGLNAVITEEMKWNNLHFKENLALFLNPAWFLLHSNVKKFPYF